MLLRWYFSHDQNQQFTGEVSRESFPNKSIRIKLSFIALRCLGNDSLRLLSFIIKEERTLECTEVINGDIQTLSKLSQRLSMILYHNLQAKSSVVN